MRFQVPQFIEVEDKLFGPLTVTQFIYLAGGIGFFVALWLLLPLWVALILGGPVALFGASLAFFKVNDRPFINVVQSALEYQTKHRLYVWDKTKKTPDKTLQVKDVEAEDDVAKYVPATTATKLKDLAWSLDIKESMYSDRNQK